MKKLLFLLVFIPLVSFNSFNSYSQSTGDVIDIMVEAQKGYIGYEKDGMIGMELLNENNTTLIYQYNILREDIAKDLIDDIDTYKENLKKTNITSFKKLSKTARDHNIIVKWRYFYDGKIIMEIVVYPNEWANEEIIRSPEFKPDNNALADLFIADVSARLFSKAYYNIGLEKKELKDYDGAIAYFTKSIDLNPNNAMAYYNRGNVKYDLKDYDGAISDYNKSIDLDPNNSLLYATRGLAKYYLKDYNGAISDYNKSINLTPNSSVVYYERGLAKQYLKDYDGAISDYNKSIDLDPNNNSVYYNRGRTKSFLKDYDGAISDYNKSIDLDPNNSLPYAARALAKERTGIDGCADARKANELGYNSDTLIAFVCKPFPPTPNIDNPK